VIGICNYEGSSENISPPPPHTTCHRGIKICELMFQNSTWVTLDSACQYKADCKHDCTRASCTKEKQRAVVHSLWAENFRHLSAQNGCYLSGVCTNWLHFQEWPILNAKDGCQQQTKMGIGKSHTNLQSWLWCTQFHHKLLNSNVTYLIGTINILAVVTLWFWLWQFNMGRMFQLPGVSIVPV
jgi:hypothetical protein